jgi:CRP-like cAMP-binding protein
MTSSLENGSASQQAHGAPNSVPTGKSPINKSGHNRLLSLLPVGDRERLVGRCRRESGETGAIIYPVRGAISNVYFPLSGMVSLVLANGESSTAIEVGMIGNEGIVGASTFLGAETSPTIAMWQVRGESLRMSASDLMAAAAQAGPLRSALAHYAQALLIQITQSVLCNNAHSVDQRLCRWLLMTHDRVGADDLPLTQEFLAQMLGSRRPSVTVAAGMLQKAGLITYHRGLIKVVSRQGLEAGACECYGVVRREFERLLA